MMSSTKANLVAAQIQRDLEDVLTGANHARSLTSAPMRESISQSVSGFMNKLGIENKVTVLPAWDYMTTLDKLKWFIVNRLIPSIGKTIRVQNGFAIGFRRRFAGALGTFGVPPELKEPELPKWALEDPHSILVVDFIMKVPQSKIKESVF